MRYASVAAHLIWLASCSQQQRDVSYRGEKISSSQVSTSQASTDDANPAVDAKPSSEVLDDRPVTVLTKQMLLSLRTETDTSALGAAFSGEILSAQQIAPEKTLFYAKGNVSYLFDEAAQGVLGKLTAPFVFSPESSVYVLENSRFWLFDSGSIAFPAAMPSSQAGQVTLYTIVPEVMKNPELKPRTLFVGPRHLILAVQNRANIVTLDGDKARVLSFDFPKAGAAAPFDVIYAGLGDSDDLFWFATSDRLLALKKSPKGDWSWQISPFKIDVPAADPTTIKLTMMLKVDENQNFTSVGKPIVFADGKIFSGAGLKLSLPDPKAAAVTADFNANIKPLLTANCVTCHAGYDTEANARLKADAFKAQIGNKTMPPTAPLLEADIQKILTWYGSIPL